MPSNRYRLDIETKGAGKSEKQIKGVSSSLGGMAKKMGMVAGAYFGGQALLSGINASVDAFKRQEMAEVKLNQVLKSTNGAVGLTSTALKDMAKNLSSVTNFSDEAIIEAEALMLTFTQIGGDVMPNAIETMLNMSTAMGTDLKGQTIQLGKALNDPIKGVSALADVGVSLSETQKQQVKDFMAVNDIASAQKVILDELEVEFGGMARAGATTFTGSMAQMKNAIGDLGETIGKGLAPSLQAGAVVIKDFARNSAEFLTNMMSIDWGETASNMMGNLSGLLSAIIETIKAYLGFLPELFKGVFSKIVPIAKSVMANLWKAVKGVASFIFEPIVMAGRIMGAKISNFFTDSINSIKETYNSIAEFVGMNPLDMTPRISEEGLEMANTRIGEFFTDLSENSIETQTDMTDRMKEIWSDYADDVVEANESIAESVEGTTVAVDSNTSAIETNEDAVVKTGETKKKVEKMTTEEAVKGNASMRDTMIKAIRGEALEGLSGYISSIFKTVPFPLNLGLSAGASGLIMGLFDQLASKVPQFAEGGSMMVSRPTLFLAGEDGAESVSVTNLEKPFGGANAGGGGITLNISAPLVDESVIDHIIPAIERATRLGLA